MAAPDPIPLQTLLDQADWARRLARRLVRDEHAADDLVQRTWVAALEHPPRGAARAPRSTLQGWIGSVMRNFARQDARASTRRSLREREVARSEGAADEVEHGLELQQRLLQAMRSLAEPCRGALYARYFEGLPPREIARREGVPLKTIKSRLARGLALLRERLERDHGGDRRAWLAWIAPLAAKPALSLGILGVIVDTKLKVSAACAAALLVLAVGAQLMREELDSPVQAPALAAASPLLPQPAQNALEQGAETDARVGVEAPAVEPAPFRHPHVERSRMHVRGRVLDLANRAVGDVRIVLEAQEDLPRGAPRPVIPSELRSDERGLFEFETPAGEGHLLVDDARWATAYKAALFPSRDLTQLKIFVAPKLEFSGIVVDEQHRPIEGADVELRFDAAIKHDSELRTEHSVQALFLGKSEVQGRFRLAGVPACAARLHASMTGFEPASIEAPASSDSGLEIVLAPRKGGPAIVRGIVLDEARAPLAGVSLALGTQSFTSGDDGRFEFDLDADYVQGQTWLGPGEPWASKYPRTRLRAAKQGLLPAELELPPIETLRAQPLPHEVTLVLEGEMLSISGQVTESDGKPAGDVELMLLDETPFGIVHWRIGASMVGREASLEELLRGDAQGVTHRTSKDGNFAIGGLSRRRYDLAALDSRSLRTTIVRGVAAGSRGVQVELAGVESLEPVAGRVVSRAGAGLEGIHLQVGRLLRSPDVPEFTRNLQTDAQGRFDLGSIDPTDLCIQVLGEQIFLIMAWQPPEGAQLDALEIVVSQRCMLRVEIAPGGTAADEFSFVDADGAATQNFHFEGTMIGLRERCSLVEGRSELYATEDTARTLLLYREGREVARVPVQLLPGQLVVLRP